MHRQRIVYIRFCTKSAVLLPRIKIHNTELEIRTLIVETFGHLYGNNEVFIEGATNKSTLFWKKWRYPFLKDCSNYWNIAEIFVRGSGFKGRKLTISALPFNLDCSLQPCTFNPLNLFGLNLFFMAYLRVRSS